MVSFKICIEDTGNQSDNIVTAIRIVIGDCLQVSPSNEKLIRQSLATSLPLSHVMGPYYRYVHVQKIGSHFFILIKTLLEGGGRGKHVIVWALRRKVGNTLKDICMDTIMGRLRRKEEVEMLGLPETLQIDFIEEFCRNPTEPNST